MLNELVLLSLVILALPLAGFLLLLFNQRGMRVRAHLVGVPIAMFALTLAAYVVYMKLRWLPGVLETNVNWVDLGVIPGVGAVTIQLGIMLDNAAAIYMAVVLLISLLVQIFSVQYMKGDAHYARYFALLGFFTFAMLGIVLSNNFLSLFICWELASFSSYMLIGHWSARQGSQSAARRAFITNLVGDMAMLMGIALLFSQFQTLGFTAIFEQMADVKAGGFGLFDLSTQETLTAAGLLVFAGAAAKSAQFPLHVWLPDAMEAPTPVSAFIHSATMVAAGVWLVARIYPILTPDAMLTIAVLGGITAILGGLMALVQQDIKKILAYSTMSQLGVMMLALGCGAYSAALIALVAHAFYKSALFLGAGGITYTMLHAFRKEEDHFSDSHDIRHMGGLRRRMPITFAAVLLASLSLVGVPLFAGHLAKSEILAATFAHSALMGGIGESFPYVFLASAFLATLYMSRMLLTVFFGEPALPLVYERVREMPRIMTIPLAILALLSLWLPFGFNPINGDTGWAAKKWFPEPGQVVATVSPTSSIPGEVSPDRTVDIRLIPPPNATLDQPEFVQTPEQRRLASLRSEYGPLSSLYLLLAVALGAGASWLVFYRRPSIASAIGRGPIYRFVQNKMYLDTLYQYLFSDSVNMLARVVARFDDDVLEPAGARAGRFTQWIARGVAAFDTHVLDNLVHLAGGVLQFAGLLVRSAQAGRVQTYLRWTLAVVVVTIALRFYFIGTLL